MKFIKSKADYRHLIAGGIAASLTASICCIGPLVLLTTGVSGAWMSNLMIFERYQAILITATLLAFALAGRSLFFASNAASDGDCCEESGTDWKKASVFAASSCLALVFISSEYWIQFVL
ncbi:MAG: mercuric transporter MerT family protein [Gammaproteobacteria bacterium]|nr:mercuric transporter MerT family protein [Gammaproteobacteria bacterium]MDG2337108.1 mercuric transporter MerT family protein [Gammaproteobacteria bacterium]